jgi:glycosyltransferase involved in cell wall biosynthesis
MKQLRVCFFPDSLGTGGIGRVNLNLAQGFLERGVAVDFFLNRQDERVRQIPKGARVFFGKGTTRASLWPLIAYLRTEHPNVFITSHTYITIASSLAKLLAGVRTRIIVTMHTTFSQDDLSGKSKSLYIRLSTFLCRWIYPQADSIVAVSQAVANDAASFLKLDSKRIQVIYNPVVTPSLYAKSNSEPTHPFFRNKTAPILLAVGRLTTQKDFTTLLHAFAELRKTKFAKLIILGEGEERGVLETLAHRLNLGDDFSMPGFVENPYPYLKSADVFVSSSAWEGLPTVIIEALALGTPVVATDCPGGTKEILGNSQYGSLVEMKNPSALAKAVIDTLASPINKGKLEERGRAYSLEASTKQYLELLGVS